MGFSYFRSLYILTKRNKLLSLSIIILGCVVSLGIISRFTATEESAVTYSTKEDSFLPVRIKIPTIDIDATVDHVGIDPDGSMDVPSGPESVAWFNLGPRPGEIGSAVINGHSGWKNGTATVFDDLYKLKKGDKIYVEDGKGITTIFVVRERRKYDPAADTGRVFGSSDGKSHLNLITCAGIWNDADKTHSERLVVFTDKLME